MKLHGNQGSSKGKRARVSLPGDSPGTMSNPQGAGGKLKETRTTEGETRHRIMLLLLKEGPITASYLGKQLGLSAAGVRRHLDNLLEDGLTEVVSRKPLKATSGRGRPAKHFRLTDQGRAHFGHAYDELATDALIALRAAGGSTAVRQFAKLRFEKMLQNLDVTVSEDEDVEEVARKLAHALDDLGYAATVTTVGAGVQICQHHCPISHVAAVHPELCEAEQEVFSNLLNRHVQPLASIADGHGICTTNIPLTITPVPESNKPGAEENRHSERSAS